MIMTKVSQVLEIQRLIYLLLSRIYCQIELLRNTPIVLRAVLTRHALDSHDDAQQDLSIIQLEN